MNPQDNQTVFGHDYYYGRKNSNYPNYEKYDNDSYWKPFLRTINSVHQQGGRLLDVGCAFGYFLKRAAPLFDEVYGADISEFAVKKAKQSLPQASLAVVNLDNDGLSFPDNFFDIVTAFDVLEHTKSVPDNLARIFAKLKPGGCLLCSLPVRDTWAGRIFSWLDRDITHIRVPTRKELTDFIERSGFKVVNQHYFTNVVRWQIPGIPVDTALLLQKTM